MEEEESWVFSIDRETPPPDATATEASRDEFSPLSSLLPCQLGASHTQTVIYNSLPPSSSSWSSYFLSLRPFPSSSYIVNSFPFSSSLLISPSLCVCVCIYRRHKFSSSLLVFSIKENHIHTKHIHHTHKPEKLLLLLFSVK